MGMEQCQDPIGVGNTSCMVCSLHLLENFIHLKRGSFHHVNSVWVGVALFNPLRLEAYTN